VEDIMKRVTRSTIIALAVAVALAACQDGVSPVSTGAPLALVTEELAPLVPRIIAPSATDPAIDWIPAVNPQFNHHYVWLDQSQKSNPKLFVFMPGTGARPRGYQLVQQEAARVGYHVIGLMYQNNAGVVESCAGGVDANCARDMRLEILDGIPRSGFVDVSPANSIDNRLMKLLLYLDAQYPDEGWSRFLHEGAPKWSQIAVGGHSLGAGEAALIGTIRHLDRVVLFSGPPDTRVPGEPETWVSIGETPAVKYFALLHQREPSVADILTNLTALELKRFGDPLVVPELGEPRYEGSHILVTDLEPQGGYGTPNPHRSTSLDAWTPLGPDGAPLLRDAWRYLLGGLWLHDDGGEDDGDINDAVDPR
jgi:hypothetical protein